MTDPVFMFPGQGGFFGGSVRLLCEAYPEATELFGLIDVAGAAVGEQPVRPPLLDTADLGPEDMAADHCEALHLAVYGMPVFLFQHLLCKGIEPRLLVGHSLEEIAALTCAGAFTPAEGARIVHLRNAALRATARPGAMAAVGVDAAGAQALRILAGEPDLAVGCHNAPRQSVVSGEHGALKRVQAAAEALEI